MQLKANPTDAEVAKASAAQKAYDTAYQSYSRHVSIMSMGGAVLLLALSLGLERKNKVMANGILLGGLFTLVYGVARGFVSRDTTTLFITLSVALALVMVLGFRRFRTSPRRGAGAPRTSRSRARPAATSDEDPAGANISPSPARTRVPR